MPASKQTRPRQRKRAQPKRGCPWEERPPGPTSEAAHPRQAGLLAGPFLQAPRLCGRAALSREPAGPGLGTGREPRDREAAQCLAQRKATAGAPKINFRRSTSSRGENGGAFIASGPHCSSLSVSGGMIWEASPPPPSWPILPNSQGGRPSEGWIRGGGGLPDTVPTASPRLGICADTPQVGLVGGRGRCRQPLPRARLGRPRPRGTFPAGGVTGGEPRRGATRLVAPASASGRSSRWSCAC